MYYGDQSEITKAYQGTINWELDSFYGRLPRIKSELSKGYEKFNISTIQILPFPYISIGKISHCEKQLGQIEKTPKLIDDFLNVHQIDVDTYSNYLHHEVNSMRLNYDKEVENWSFNLDMEIFEPYILFIEDSIFQSRDALGYFFNGVNLVGTMSRYKWMPRMLRKIEYVDEDLKRILPILIGKTDAHKPTHNLCPDNFWWRTIEYDILSRR